MAVLLVSQVFPPKPGGSGRWLWELYRRLPEMGVHVVAGGVTGDAAFDRVAPMPISRLRFNFTSWGLLHPVSAWQHVRTFASLFAAARRSGASAIHCGKCLPEGTLGTLLKRVLGIRLVVFVHGEELTLAHGSRELRWLTSRVLHNADLIVANSANTKRLLGELYAVSSRVVVMHPGVDALRFQPSPRDETVRARLGWTGRRVVLTVGALQKRKGQDTMVRALPAVRAACPDVLYAIAGEGWERPYLEGLVRELGVSGQVQFLGVPPEAELVQLYQQCDLFVLPNRQIGWDLEGFGIVSLEAQACGKPVIVGCTGGAPETMEAGTTGIVVSGESEQELAEAVVSLLMDHPKASAMGAAGRERILARFDWPGLAQSAGTMFESVSAGGQR